MECAQNSSDADISAPAKRLESTSVIDEANLISSTLVSKGYRLGPRIGKGSYAKVKVAERIKDGVIVATKIISRNKAAKEFLRRFLPREISVLLSIKHPNIVQIFEVIQTHDFVCLVVEYAQRGDLLTYVKRRNCLGEKEAKDTFYQISDAVSYLHGRSICHRDLKCENVLIRRDYSVALTDFGFSKMVPSTDLLSSTYCGSAAYASPELLRGKPYNPFVADIWSLGCILFVTVTGQMPFYDRNTKKVKMMSRQLQGKVLYPSFCSVSRSCRDLVAKILEPNTDRRVDIGRVTSHQWLDGMSSQRIARQKALTHLRKSTKSPSVATNLPGKPQTISTNHPPNLLETAVDYISNVSTILTHDRITAVGKKAESSELHKQGQSGASTNTDGSSDVTQSPHWKTKLSHTAAISEQDRTLGGIIGSKRMEADEFVESFSIAPNVDQCDSTRSTTKTMKHKVSSYRRGRLGQTKADQFYLADASNGMAGKVAEKWHHDHDQHRDQCASSTRSRPPDADVICEKAPARIAIPDCFNEFDQAQIALNKLHVPVFSNLVSAGSSKVGENSGTVVSASVNHNIDLPHCAENSTDLIEDTPMKKDKESTAPTYVDTHKSLISTSHAKWNTDTADTATPNNRSMKSVAPAQTDSHTGTLSRFDKNMGWLTATGTKRGEGSAGSSCKGKTKKSVFRSKQATPVDSFGSIERRFQKNIENILRTPGSKSPPSHASEVESGKPVSSSSKQKEDFKPVITIHCDGAYISSLQFRLKADHSISRECRLDADIDSNPNPANNINAKAAENPCPNKPIGKTRRRSNYTVETSDTAGMAPRVETPSQRFHSRQEGLVSQMRRIFESKDASTSTHQTKRQGQDN